MVKTIVVGPGPRLPGPQLPSPQLPSTQYNHTVPAGLAAFYSWQQSQAGTATTDQTGIADKNVRPKTKAR